MQLRKKYEQFYSVTDEKFNKDEFEKKVVERKSFKNQRYRSWSYFLFW